MGTDIIFVVSYNVQKDMSEDCAKNLGGEVDIDLILVLTVGPSRV